MSDPTVLTIILNFRTPEMTLKAAEAALREMAGIAGEVVIVDNGSDDGSFGQIDRAIDARGWDRTRLHLKASGRNGGFGAGNNFAIRQGLSDGRRPDYVYLLNSDAWPDTGGIRALLDYLEGHREVGMAGSFIHGPDGAAHQTAFRFPTMASEFEGAAHTGLITRLLRHATVPLPIPTTPERVDWVAGASVMMRHDMLERIGLFDETFFLYFEETDLCHRAARGGWQVHFVPQSSVTHIGSASTGMKKWRRTPAYWFASRQHYFTKTYGRAYAAGALLAHVAGGMIWRLRCIISGRDIGDPPRFLRDLFNHGLCSGLSPAPRLQRPAPLAQSTGGTKNG